MLKIITLFSKSPLNLSAEWDTSGDVTEVGPETLRGCGQLGSVRNEDNALLKSSCMEQCENIADD